MPSGLPHTGTGPGTREQRRREEQARKAAAKAAAYARRLGELAAEGEAPWKQVDEMIATKKTSEARPGCGPAARPAGARQTPRRRGRIRQARPGSARPVPGQARPAGSFQRSEHAAALAPCQTLEEDQRLNPDPGLARPAARQRRYPAGRARRDRTAWYSRRRSKTSTRNASTASPRAACRGVRKLSATHRLIQPVPLSLSGRRRTATAVRRQ